MVIHHLGQNGSIVLVALTGCHEDSFLTKSKVRFVRDFCLNVQ